MGRGKTAEWLGSIALDGYPEAMDLAILEATTEADREAVEHFLKSREDATPAAQGWPWPWENSNTTDYAYAWEEPRVWGTCFGHGWWPALHEPKDNRDEPKTIEWPDVKRRQVADGKRSGIFILNVPR